jgi:hypothetical protein
MYCTTHTRRIAPVDRCHGAHIGRRLRGTHAPSASAVAARLPIIRCALRALPVPRHRLISARFARHVKRIGAAFGDDEASRAAATLAVQIGIGFGERRCDHERSHSLVMANRRVGDHRRSSAALRRNLATHVRALSSRRKQYRAWTRPLSCRGSTQ